VPPAKAAEPSAGPWASITQPSQGWPHRSCHDDQRQPDKGQTAYRWSLIWPRGLGKPSARL
jgi:hypothetical protein